MDTLTNNFKWKNFLIDMIIEMMIDYIDRGTVRQKPHVNSMREKKNLNLIMNVCLK